MESVKKYFENPDLGLLLLRLIVAGMMIAHGVGKFMGGNFEGLGSNMAVFGIEFGYAFWGFMAALAQTVGGFLVVVGFVFRLACVMVLCTMIVAVAMHLDAGDGIMGSGHAIKTGAVFLALLFTGAGRYALKRD